MTSSAAKGRPIATLAIRLAALLMSLAAAAAGTSTHASAAPDDACHVGAYRLADGQILDIGLSDGGLRWRRFDGETGKLTPGAAGLRNTSGWSDRPDPRPVTFGSCADGTIDVGGVPGRRIPLATQEISFPVRGGALAGRLVLPAGRQRVPIVVLLQGSEHTSARDYDALQRLLPAAGVGAFVFDKRGTGASDGAYTQDFSQLADDAVAALAAARKLAGPRAGRIGFQGPSQGGWIAPLAAHRAPVDFVIVSFGLAVSVAQEDEEAMAFQMRLAGDDAEAIAKAQEISRAAATVFGSGFTQGIEAFDALRQTYRDEPWFKHVHGNFTYVLLAMTVDELRQAGSKYNWGTPLWYDPRPALEGPIPPQLWVLGGQDIDAPSGETARRLRRLIAGGQPITLAIYPNAEHGMTAFTTETDGSRTSTRYAAGYFRMMRDFAQSGCLRPPYGDALITGLKVDGCRPAPRRRR